MPCKSNMNSWKLEDLEMVFPINSHPLGVIQLFFFHLRQRLTNEVAMASVVGTSAMSGLKAGWFAE